MALVLPPSLDKDRHPITEEVAYARSLGPEGRLRLTAMVCRSALRVLNMHPKRDRVLALRDPVPESTRVALRRLRAGA
jgi:hypothetical protein